MSSFTFYLFIYFRPVHKSQKFLTSDIIVGLKLRNESARYCSAKFGLSTLNSKFNKKCKSKLQVLQNKCACFCLQLANRQHIGIEHFDRINWLPVDQSFKQYLSTSVFKFFSEMCPQYMNEIYKTILLLEILV